ncbi:hypothetical protein SAMN02910357_02101 [Succinivibrio dextrinosolvens]|uniref:hypothetical protein n=1 Tax=Succinivibrio dextrinosolvens TaxID=83771 RepID=UPI0008F308E8|nr:hypothetical protein [Succinivibrio dextrinosolvens]SFS83253.1 hypothetical protein SAMN02910357_02101 [Succinivibrio dextrinosolvens]
MKIAKLDSMVKGWFIGNFDPSLCKTKDCEVAVKYYKKGDFEQSHFHKIATEYTVVLKGRVRMFDQEFSEGAIIIVEPGESTAFESLDDSINVVVKIPSVKNDKYVVGE